MAVLNKFSSGIFLSLTIFVYLETLQDAGAMYNTDQQGYQQYQGQPYQNQPPNYETQPQPPYNGQGGQAPYFALDPYSNQYYLVTPNVGSNGIPAFNSGAPTSGMFCPYIDPQHPQTAAQNHQPYVPYDYNGNTYAESPPHAAHLTPVDMPVVHGFIYDIAHKLMPEGDTRKAIDDAFGTLKLYTTKQPHEIVLKMDSVTAELDAKIHTIPNQVGSGPGVPAPNVPGINIPDAQDKNEATALLVLGGQVLYLADLLMQKNAGVQIAQGQKIKVQRSMDLLSSKVGSCGYPKLRSLLNFAMDTLDGKVNLSFNSFLGILNEKLHKRFGGTSNGNGNGSQASEVASQAFSYITGQASRFFKDGKKYSGNWHNGSTSHGPTTGHNSLKPPAPHRPGRTIPKLHGHGSHGSDLGDTFSEVSDSVSNGLSSAFGSLFEGSGGGSSFSGFSSGLGDLASGFGGAFGDKK